MAKNDPPPPPVACPNCGEVSPANRWVCPHCGSPLRQALDSQRSYTPYTGAGLPRISIPVRRRRPIEEYEPLRAGRLPSLFIVLEIVAAVAALLVLGGLAWNWAQNAALQRQRTPTAAARTPLSPGGSILPGGMTAAPPASATPGPSPTPFSLYLPTPDEDARLPAVTRRPLEGEGLVQITSNTQRDYSPAYTRDQSRMVFTTEIDGHWQIVEADPQSGEVLRRVTNDSIDYYTPLFNADGTQLLVVADFSVNLDLFLLRLEDGRVLRQLTFSEADDFAPAWLPDYSGIVFTSMRDDNAELYLMRIPEVQVAEPEVVRLTDNPAFDGYPTVSHSGETVAFYSDRAEEWNYDIFIMPFNGLIARRLTRDPARDASPAFAPGDAWIVFESNRSGNYELYAIRPNAQDDATVENLTYTEGNEYMPGFTPDGLWLVYISDINRNMDIFRRPWP